MQKYRDVVQDRSGNAVVGVLVRVQTYPGAVDAVIYSDDGSTLADNPITTGANGEFEFYVADGQYQLVVSGTGITTRTITDIQIEDVGDPSAGVFSSLQVSGTSTLSGAVTAGSTLLVGTSVSAPEITATTRFLAGDGSDGAPSYSFASDTDTGIRRVSANFGVGVAAGARIFGWDAAAAFRVRGDSAISWSIGSDVTQTNQVSLYGDIANTLSQRNSTNAQTFRVYNTFTDSSNYERGAINWSSNVLRIETQAAGTGADRAIVINAANTLHLRRGGVNGWFIDGSSHFGAEADNTNDIGASGATRPRSLYWGTQALAANGTKAAPSYAFASAPGVGWYWRTGQFLSLALSGVENYLFGSSGMNIPVALGFAAVNTDFTSNGCDVIVTREGAGVLAQRNSTNAQTFRVYNTFTDASNYERGYVAWGSGGEANILIVGTEAAGTGSARQTKIKGTRVLFQSTILGTDSWQVDTDGHFKAVTDNTYDIGASGATRPRSIYWGTQALAPAGLVGSPSYSFAGAPSSGMWGGTTVQFSSSGVTQFLIDSNGFAARGAISIGDTAGTPDVFLVREAADVLATRRSTNAQKFNVYNTFTDGSNYERGFMWWTSNVLHLGMEAAGSGTATRTIRFYTGGTGKWDINGSGHFLATSDNTYDIGASGATRPRDLHLGRDLFIGGASMPQNSQSADYTLVAADANKHVHHPVADTNNRTFTIPANASVAFAIGTCVTFINDASANTVAIAITSDTLVDTAGSTGTRTLAAYGIATAVKVTSTKWRISGTGLS